MDIVVSLGIGLLVATGIYLALRPSAFSVVLGLTLLSYAVNVLIFLGGRLLAVTPPLVLPGTSRHADPLPQALVLTAIVIGFGMTAYLAALMLRSKAENGTDHVDGREETP